LFNASFIQADEYKRLLNMALCMEISLLSIFSASEWGLGPFLGKQGKIFLADQHLLQFDPISSWI